MMTRVQVVFKAIDVLFYRPQNAISFDNITCVKDIEYSPLGGKYTSGDLYYDKNYLKTQKKLPIILNIHGGGFVMGDKDYRRTVSEFFAHSGYCVFSVNHRMPPDVIFPEFINDCVDALNYIEELAKKYDFIDTDRIIVSGDSSGGYNAVYLAALSFDKELAEKIDAHEIKVKIKALAPFCGMYDLKRVFHGYLPFGLLGSMASMVFGYKVKRYLTNIHDFKYYDYISPIEYVNGEWCPTFIAWAKKDLICVKQGDVMAKKLMENIEQVGTFTSTDIWNNHCFHLLLKNPVAIDCMNVAIRYIDEYCKD